VPGYRSSKPPVGSNLARAISTRLTGRGPAKRIVKTMPLADRQPDVPRTLRSRVERLRVTRADATSTVWAYHRGWTPQTRFVDMA
jgi:hypothetical protein